MKKRSIIFLVSGVVLIAFSIFYFVLHTSDNFNKYYQGDYNKAYTKLLKQAKAGNTNAQVNLGNLCSAGLGIKQNYKKAYFWYNKAAKKNNAAALASLGSMYQYGKYVETNYREAIRLYKKAIELDPSNSSAKYNLSLIYLNNINDKTNFGKGLKLLQDSADQNNPGAQSELGTAYYMGMYNLQLDYKKALNLLTKSSNLGYPVAQNNLAVVYYQGKAVPKDDFNAYKWFYISANYGKYSKAINLLSIYTFKLTDIEKKKAVVEAKKWIKTHKEMNFNLIAANPN